MLQSFMPTLACLHTQTFVLFVLVAYCYTYHHYVLQLRVTNDRLLYYQSYSTENSSNCLGHQVIYPRTRGSFRHDVNSKFKHQWHNNQEWVLMLKTFFPNWNLSLFFRNKCLCLFLSLFFFFLNLSGYLLFMNFLKQLDISIFYILLLAMEIIYITVFCMQLLSGHLTPDWFHI